MSAFEEFLASRLREIEAAGLTRSLRVLHSAQGPEVILDGREVVNFSSNDYLGLASHPRLREAAAQALQEAGAGAGASRLICGTHHYHEALETALARFKRTEAALSFSSGYAAALGVIPAVVGEGDVVILDKLSHASLIDAARLSGAFLRVFPHNHIDKLESHLRWARDKYPAARLLVVAESVYSMDGDRALLREIVEVKERFGAWLFLDEAHAVGVVGGQGRGLADLEGVADRVEIQMGTLGKALGSSGAYVCGSARLREFLINRARSFIFSTAPPPHVAASAMAAVGLLESAEGAVLLKALHSCMAAFAGHASAPSAIFPVPIGDERAAVALSQALIDKGLLVPAIRYPTVARGAARLRVVVTAAHELAQITRLARELDALRQAQPPR